MTIYYVTILIFLMLGYFYDRLADADVNNDKTIAICIVIVVFLLVYGFRFEVGVDWFNYIRVYERQVADIYSFNTLEVGYKFLNIVSYYTNKNIQTVIFLSTFLFISFTLFGIRRLNLNPFYFFSLVAPYHLVMSGVNYTRQAIALSIFIYSLSFLRENRKLSFLVIIFLAGSFHTSALIFVLLAFIDVKKRFLIPILLLCIPVFSLFMLKQYNQYLETSMDNAGLLLRVLFIIAPSFFIIIYYKSINKLDLVTKRFCYLTVISFPALLLLSILSSTIADRLSYYFILLSAISWMLLNKSIDYSGKKYLNYYGSAAMFLSSLLAFTVWIMFSKYFYAYNFKHILFQ